MVQHCAVRFVLNKLWYKSNNHDSVTEILTNLGWPKLEERRKIARLWKTDHFVTYSYDISFGLRHSDSS